LELGLAFALAYAALLHEQIVNVQQIALQKAEFLNIMRCSFRRNFLQKGHFGLMFLCSAAELHEKPGCHRGTKCPHEAAFFVARTRLAGAKAATSSLILIPAGENFH
jgi:hypothetical protein